VSFQQILWLLLLFCVGFFTAKTVSQSNTSAVRSTEHVLERKRQSRATRSQLESSEVSVGFTAEVNLLKRVEAAFNRGDFQSILAGLGHGDWIEVAAFAWAKEDPASFWKWLDSGGKLDREIWGIYPAIFKNWYQLDSDAALAALRKSNKNIANASIRGILELLFSDDPEVARSVGLRLDEIIGDFQPDLRHSGSLGFAGNLNTVEKMKNLPESHAKRDLVHFAVAHWFSKDWKSARDWAMVLPDGERIEMEHALFNMRLPLRVLHSEEAMSWVEGWLEKEENHDMRTKLSSQLLFSMAENDPEAAMQWATSNLGGATLGEAIGTLVSKQLNKDQSAAYEMVDSLPPGGLRKQAGRSLIKALRKKDAPAAYDRAVSELQTGFDIGLQDWQQIGIRLARSHPDEAFDILDNVPENVPPIFKNRTIDYLTSWHPQATIEWARQQGGERGAAIENQVIRSWKVSDPKGFKKWNP